MRFAILARGCAPRPGIPGRSARASRRILPMDRPQRSSRRRHPSLRARGRSRATAIRSSRRPRRRPWAKATGRAEVLLRRATDPSHRDPRDNPPTVAMSAARLPIPVRERTYTCIRRGSRVVRPRRGIVDGVGFCVFPPRAPADHARRRAARPRGIARPSARLRESKRDASEAPTARDSSRTWRGGVCVARVTTERT